MKNSWKVTDEISIYRILNVVAWMDENELWIKVYEYGLKKKIEPRDSLQKEYAQRKERG